MQPPRLACYFMEREREGGGREGGREREAFEGKMTYVMIIQKGNPSAKHVFPSKKGTRTGWLGKELKRCARP